MNSAAVSTFNYDRDTLRGHSEHSTAQPVRCDILLVFVFNSLQISDRIH
jgi:hypothetical protein